MYYLCTSSNWADDATVRRSVALLGATGSIGTRPSTSCVANRNCSVVALSGGEQLGEWRASSMSSTSRASLSSATPSRHVAQSWGQRRHRGRDEGLSALAASADITSTRSRIRRLPSRSRPEPERLASQQGVAHRGGAAGGEGPSTPGARCCQSTPNTAPSTMLASSPASGLP